MSTTIDLSRIPAPAAIEPLDFETLFTAYRDRFTAAWLELRADEYDVGMLETDPAMIVGQAGAYLRLLDRRRVNDAVLAVLAPTATGTDLDNVAARVNIARLDGETDPQLLRRYLMAFDRPSAGSADRYLYEVFTAWPQCLSANVVGQAKHGRKGDVDIVLAGPGGRVPTTQELATVRAVVTRTNVKPVATAVTVLSADRVTYAVRLEITVPRGPDPAVVRSEAQARVAAVCAERMQVEGEVPMDLLTGAAYGPNVITVTRLSPTADISPSPYKMPVATSIEITTRVRG